MIRVREKNEKCEITGQEFVISQEEAELYEHFELPLPKIAPSERMRHQLAFRNDQQLFVRPCAATNQQIISIYPAEAPVSVVSLDYWYSDQWDPVSYGRPFDFGRMFVEQFIELWWRVPRPAVNAREARGCFAVNNAYKIANCQNLFEGYYSTLCFNSSYLLNSRECADCLGVFGCNQCYECIFCRSCTKLRWSMNCIECSDSWFLAECKGCKNCLFCTNLEGKEYHIFNRPVTKEVFAQAVREWDFSSRTKVELARQRFMQFLADKPVPHCISELAQSNSGNYLFSCNDTRNSYACVDSSQIYNCNHLLNARRCLDGYGFGGTVTQSAQFVGVGANASEIVNCIECWQNVRSLTYCSHCEDSSNLFACVGLRGKEYCIFNVQYSKEEYLRLRSEIVQFLKSREIYGRFFPAQFSPHAYNHSSANLYMPLGKVAAKMLGFRWDESEPWARASELLKYRTPSEVPLEKTAKPTMDEVMATAQVFEVPQRLDSVEAEWYEGKVFLCELSGKPFAISPQEFELYKTLGVAPPVRAFEQRNRDRIQLIAPKSLVATLNVSAEPCATSFPEAWYRPVVHHEQWLAGRLYNTKKK